MKIKKSEVVASIREFFGNRERAKELKESIEVQQPELIALMKVLDPDNAGIVWDENNESKGAAYVQANSGSEVWDEEAIISFVKKDKKLWMACSSRIFDVRKFEAEVANGNIPTKVAKKFKVTTPPPKPFIRFGKIKKGNL